MLANSSCLDNIKETKELLMKVVTDTCLILGCTHNQNTSPLKMYTVNGSFHYNGVHLIAQYHISHFTTYRVSMELQRSRFHTLLPIYASRMQSKEVSSQLNRVL